MTEAPLIVLGVSGGIAAYKSADLTSKLVKKGYQVQVVMTENATKLVTPLTFQTLSRRRVITSLWDNPEWRPEHVALANEASLLIIAPATANILAKLAHGIADDALTTLAVAHAPSPVLLAPAMNPRMFANNQVQENLRKLRANGYDIVGPESGHVACGEPGAGRMSDPTDILAAAEKILKKNLS